MAPKRYNITKIIPDISRSDSGAREQINIKESELINIENEIDNHITGETLKEELTKQKVDIKKKSVLKNKEEFETSLDKIAEDEVIDKLEKARDKFVKGYTDDIAQYQEEAAFRTEKAMDMLNFRSITNAIIKQKWEARKLENLGDINKETVALPNDSYDDNIQTSLRLNPDYYSTPRNVFMNMKSSNKTPLLVCKLQALDVEYRKDGYLNSDLGAFQLKVQIRGNNTAIDLELFSTLISVGKYGCAIFSEGSMHDDDTLGLYVYKKNNTNEIYIALQNKEDDNKRDTLAFDINISVLLGDNLELPFDNSTSFTPDNENYVLIGEAEFKQDNAFEYGPKNLELKDRSYSDRVMNDRVYSADDIFGDTQIVRVNSVEADINNANVQVLPITEKEHLNNARLENQVMLGNNKKIAYMNNFRENLPNLDYFDKDNSLLYLGTNDGLVLYKDSGSFMQFHPEFSDVIIKKVIYHSFTKKLYVLTNEGLFYSDNKNDEGVFSNFIEYKVPDIDYEYREDLIAEDADEKYQITENRDVKQTQTYHYTSDEMEIMDFMVSGANYEEDTPRESNTADFTLPMKLLEENSENYGVTDYLETRVVDDVNRVLIIDSKVYKYKNFGEKEEVTFESRAGGNLKAHCMFEGKDKTDGSQYFGIIFDKSIFMSKDLENWEEMNFPITARNKRWVQCKYIDFGGNDGGKFIAITDSENDTHKILMSLDGKEWYTKELPNVTGKWRHMASGYIGGEYNRIVLVLVSYEGIGDRIVTSVDGENYIVRDLKFGGKFRGVQYVNTTILADSANVPDYQEVERDGKTYGFIKRGFLAYGETYNGQIGLFYSYNANDWLKCEPMDTNLNTLGIVFDLHLNKDIISRYAGVYNKSLNEVSTELQTGTDFTGKAYLSHKIVTKDTGETVCEVNGVTISSDLSDERLCVKGFKLNNFQSIQPYTPKSSDILNTTINDANVYEIEMLNINEYRGANRIVFTVKDNKLNEVKYASEYVSSVIDEYSVPYHQEVILLKLWLKDFVHNIPRNAVAYKTFSSYYDDYYHHNNSGTVPKSEVFASKFHIGGMPKASQQALLKDDKFLDKYGEIYESGSYNADAIENYIRNQLTMIANTYLFPGGMILLGERIAYERNNQDNKLNERFLIMSNEYNDDREFNLGSEQSDLVLTGSLNNGQLIFKNSEDFHPFQQLISMIYGNKEMTKIVLIARGNQRIGLISSDKGNSYQWSKAELIVGNTTLAFENNASDFRKNRDNSNDKITNISVDIDSNSNNIYTLERVIETPTYSTPPQREGTLKYVFKVELINWTGRTYDLPEDYLDNEKFVIWQTYGAGESGFVAGRWVDTQQFKNLYESYNQPEQMNFYLYDLSKLSIDISDESILKNYTKFYLNISKVIDDEALEVLSRIKLEDYMLLEDVRLLFWHVIKSPNSNKVLLLSAEETSNVSTNAYLKEINGYRLFSLDLDDSNMPVGRMKEIKLKDSEWNFVQSMSCYGVPNSGNPWVQFNPNGEMIALLSHDVREILTDAVLTVLDNTKITFRDDMTDDRDDNNTIPLKSLDGSFYDDDGKFYMSSIYRNADSDYWMFKSIDTNTGVTTVVDAKQFFNLPTEETDIFSIVRKLSDVPEGLKCAYLLFKNVSPTVEGKPSSSYFYIVTHSDEDIKVCHKINFTGEWKRYTVSNMANNNEFAVIIEDNTSVTRCGIKWDGLIPSLNFNIGSYTLPVVGLKTIIDSKTTLGAFNKFSSWEIVVNETRTVLRYKYGFKQADFDAISNIEKEKMLLSFDKVYALTTRKIVNENPEGATETIETKEFTEVSSLAVWSDSTSGNTVYYIVDDTTNTTPELTDDKVSYAKNILNVAAEENITSNLEENDIMLLAVDGIESRDLINSQNPGDSLQLSENSLLIQHSFKKKDATGTNPSIYNTFEVYNVYDISDDTVGFAKESKYPTYDYSVRPDETKKLYVPYASIKLLKDNSIMVFIPQTASDDGRFKWRNLETKYCIYHEESTQWRILSSNVKNVLNIENLDKYYDISREILYDVSSDNMYFYNSNMLTKIPYSNQAPHDDSIYNIKKYHFCKIDEEGSILKSLKFDRKILPWASDMENAFGVDFVADFSINKKSGNILISTAIRIGTVYANFESIVYEDYPEKALECFKATHTGDGRAVTLKAVSNNYGSTIALFVPRTVQNTLIMELKKKQNIVDNPDNANNFIDAKTNILFIKRVGNNWEEFDLNSISYEYVDEIQSDLDKGLILPDDIKNNLGKLEITNLIKDLFITEEGKIIFFLCREFVLSHTSSYWFGNKNFSSAHYLEYNLEGKWTHTNPVFNYFADVSVLKYSSKYCYNHDSRQIVGICDSNQMTKMDINTYRPNPTSYVLFGYLDKAISDGTTNYTRDTSKFFQTKLKGLTSFRPFVEGYSTLTQDGELILIDPIAHRVFDVRKVNFDELWNNENNEYPDMIYTQRDYNIINADVLKSIPGVLVGNFFFSGVYPDFEQHDWSYKQELIDRKDYYIKEVFYGINDPRNHFLFIHKKYNFGYKVTKYLERNILDKTPYDINNDESFDIKKQFGKNYKNTNDADLNIWNRKGEMDRNNALMYKVLEETGMPYDVPCKAHGYIILEGQIKPISAIKITQPFYDTGDSRIGIIGGIEFIMDPDVQRSILDVTYRHSHQNYDAYNITNSKKTIEQFVGNNPLISMGPVEALENMGASKEYDMKQISNAFGTEQIVTAKINRRHLGSIHADVPNIAYEAQNGDGTLRHSLGITSEISDGKLVGYRSNGHPFVIDLENNMVVAESFKDDKADRNYRQKRNWKEMVKSKHYNGLKFVSAGYNEIYIQDPNIDSIYDWTKAIIRMNNIPTELTKHNYNNNLQLLFAHNDYLMGITRSNRDICFIRYSIANYLPALTSERIEGKIWWNFDNTLNHADYWLTPSYLTITSDASLMYEDKNSRIINNTTSQSILINSKIYNQYSSLINYNLSDERVYGIYLDGKKIISKENDENVLSYHVYDSYNSMNRFSVITRNPKTEEEKLSYIWVVSNQNTDNPNVNKVDLGEPFKLINIIYANDSDSDSDVVILVNADFTKSHFISLNSGLTFEKLNPDIIFKISRLVNDIHIFINTKIMKNGKFLYVLHNRCYWLDNDGYNTIVFNKKANIICLYDNKNRKLAYISEGMVEEFEFYPKLEFEQALVLDGDSFYWFSKPDENGEITVIGNIDDFKYTVEFKATFGLNNNVDEKKKIKIFGEDDVSYLYHQLNNSNYYGYYLKTGNMVTSTQINTSIEEILSRLVDEREYLLEAKMIGKVTVPNNDTYIMTSMILKSTNDSIETLCLRNTQTSSIEPLQMFNVKISENGNKLEFTDTGVNLSKGSGFVSYNYMPLIINSPYYYDKDRNSYIFTIRRSSTADAMDNYIAVVDLNDINKSYMRKIDNAGLITEMNTYLGGTTNLTTEDVKYTLNGYIAELPQFPNKLCLFILGFNDEAAHTLPLSTTVRKNNEWAKDFNKFFKRSMLTIPFILVDKAEIFDTGKTTVTPKLPLLMNYSADDGPELNAPSFYNVWDENNINTEANQFEFHDVWFYKNKIYISALIYNNAVALEDIYNTNSPFTAETFRNQKEDSQYYNLNQNTCMYNLLELSFESNEVPVTRTREQADLQSIVKEAKRWIPKFLQGFDLTLVYAKSLKTKEPNTINL